MNNGLDEEVPEGQKMNETEGEDSVGYREKGQRAVVVRIKEQDNGRENAKNHISEHRRGKNNMEDRLKNRRRNGQAGRRLCALDEDERERNNCFP